MHSRAGPCLDSVERNAGWLSNGALVNYDVARLRGRSLALLQRARGFGMRHLSREEAVTV
jgi:hypothetical protein